MIHYHGTPISPIAALNELQGRHFCVSYAAPWDVERCHAIGQSVMLDNGAFSMWRKGKPTNWPGYYDWVERWLGFPSTWAVIPDVIGAGAEVQDDLLRQWPFGDRGAPVWHMDEPLDRLLCLIDEWPCVCFGSTIEYGSPLSPAWQRRMDLCWDAIMWGRRFIPVTHMLRGLACCGHRWPFARADSTNVGRNHNRPQNTPRAMADRLDAIQTPGRWYSFAERGHLLKIRKGGVISLSV